MISNTLHLISNQGTKLLYEHATTVVDDKMYLFGGNHNGRQLNDIHVKENQEKDKIGSKPDKNEKRVEGEKSLKQLLPNGKMIVDSIENGPYVRRMIATPGEPNLPVPVSESFHEQTDEELTL
nr:acyl-CoA-binding domain-containing protein 4 [Tanacetum cinerariifolium]